jgi:hypothetical protein
MCVLTQGLIDVFSMNFQNSHDMALGDLQIGDKYLLHSVKQLTLRCSIKKPSHWCLILFEDDVY